MSSIFPVHTLDRNQVHWEDYLHELTPVEDVDGLYLKREDYFAPLGYGGINGSKVRQCIYMLDQYVRQAQMPTGVLTASSVKSPQISAVAAVAAHYGIPVTQILGATTEKAALKHENVLIGAKLGVRFIINPVAYNPALQRRLNEEHARYPDHYRMEYGLSLRAEATPAEIADFHAFGANQVRNLPAVENLIVPAGSCVSATSVLLGLVQHRVAIRDVWLVGIGPSKLSWLWKRLGVLEDYLRTDIRANYAPQGEAFEELSGPESAAGAYRLHFLDLHGRGVVNYQNEKPWSWRGIRMHPTYEGKMFHHLIHHHAELLRDNRSCFWIVGSKPTWAAMRPLIEERKVEQLQLAGLA